MNTEESQNMQNGEISLQDDHGDKSKGFAGATLSLGQEQEEPDVGFQGGSYGQKETDRAFTRVSTASTKTKTSMNPKTIVTNVMVQHFFAYRQQGAFENAVEECQRQLVKTEIDGHVKAAHLLTEIDHWDHDKEKIALICSYSLVIVKYDFIACKIMGHKRIMLHLVDKIEIGDLIYPEKSIMPPRDHGGIRLTWGKGVEPSLSAKWNPFSSDIPYLTLTHHPIIYNERETETVTYNVDDFCDSLIQEINAANRTKREGYQVQVVETAVMIESYGSLSSMIFNQSGLGYSKERGGVSF